MAETRPKVLALYQAVLELLDEGADINAMKVSDITERAGIGKGTAYDYFKSKEEIIASALTYDMGEKIQAEILRMKDYTDFAQKIRHAFDWIESQYGEQKSFTRFLRLTMQSCEVGTVLHEELRKRQQAGCTPLFIVQKICREGKETGEIRKEIPVSAASIRVISELTAFVMYLEHQQQMEDIDRGWMKYFLCNSLLESLCVK